MSAVLRSRVFLFVRVEEGNLSPSGPVCVKQYEAHIQPAAEHIPVKERETEYKRVNFVHDKKYAREFKASESYKEQCYYHNLSDICSRCRFFHHLDVSMI